MREISFARDLRDVIPMSQCSIAELQQIVRGRAKWLGTTQELSDPGIHIAYAQCLLSERGLS